MFFFDWKKKKKEIIIQTLLLDFLFNSETSAEGVLCLEITSMVYSGFLELWPYLPH